MCSISATVDMEEQMLPKVHFTHHTHVLMKKNYPLTCEHVSNRGTADRNSSCTIRQHKYENILIYQDSSQHLKMRIMLIDHMIL